MFRDIVADCNLMLDGDDTYPAKYARDMCNLIINKKADMVIGDRLTLNNLKDNKVHNFGNKLVKFLVNKLFKGDIKDVLTGYRAFSHRFVKSIPILSDGFEVETEITIHAVDKKLKILDIPIVYGSRPVGSFSKIKTYKDGYKILKTILKLYKEYRPGVYFKFHSVIMLIISLLIYVFLLNSKVFCNELVLIISLVIIMLSLLLYVVSVILHHIEVKHKKNYELFLNYIDINDRNN